MKFEAVLVAILVLTSCEQRPATRTIEFLTRQGCVNTAIMRRNLDEALSRSSRQAAYDVIDLDHLSLTDARRAYPTPTVLHGGTDLFGLPQPGPPYPEPT